MNFKPGDVLFWDNCYKEVILVLELVDEEYDVYKVFFLRSEYKNCIGKIQTACLHTVIYHLKDKKFK